MTLESNKNGNDGENIILSEEKSVVLRSGVVYRPAGPWTPGIHALLRHLQARGFESLPTVIGTGTNEEGQETVSYIEGDFIHSWTLER